ncbi:MAG: D-alanyl-D-alanine carboxypeptidase, partial [Ruminococcus sp.]|nr:D-alanyl-D-alanine carboxypeptidase [Ruminococcus sp.]
MWINEIRNYNGGKNYVIARPKESVERLWCDEVDTSLINKDKIIWYKDEFQAPVKSGDALGSVTLVYAGEELATVELVAVSDVERSKTKYNIEVAKRFHKSEWFRNAVKISIILCIVYIIICIYALIIFKSNKKPLKPIYAVPKLDKKKKKKKRPNNTRMNKQ